MLNPASLRPVVLPLSRAYDAPPNTVAAALHLTRGLRRPPLTLVPYLHRISLFSSLIWEQIIIVPTQIEHEARLTRNVTNFTFV